MKRKFYVDKDPTRTIYIQAKKTGKLKGRRLARKGEKSDKILNIRVKSPEEESGQIYGFLPSGRKTISVKGSGRSRGYSRSTL